MEVWKPIPGYEGIYEANNRGIIRRICHIYKGRKPPYYLKPQKHNHGYLSVALHKDKEQKTFLVHRLVMLAFNGLSDLHVNHLNGNKHDNRLENLEYCTMQENNAHATKENLVAHGCRVSSSKLTEDAVKDIRRRKELGENYIDIATLYEIHPMNVFQIVSRKTWARVD